MTLREHPQRAILETCDLRLDTWDTDYISDNWEQQYGQLHCDLWIESDGDSIRNSCDVLQKVYFHMDSGNYFFLGVKIDHFWGSWPKCQNRGLAPHSDILEHIEITVAWVRVLGWPKCQNGGLSEKGAGPPFWHFVQPNTFTQATVISMYFKMSEKGASPLFWHFDQDPQKWSILTP